MLPAKSYIGLVDLVYAYMSVLYIIICLMGSNKAILNLEILNLDLVSD